MNIVFAYIKSFWEVELNSESWADQKIDELKLIPHGTYRHRVVELQLPFEHVDFYVALQKRIAQIIPIEENRPTIDLYLGGKDRATTIGIIGGIGPRVDASLAQKVHGILSQQGLALEDTALNIFSAPPPRKFSILIRHLFSYIGRVWQFAKRNHAHFYLVSNTAHIRYKLVNYITSNKTINLIERVVFHLMQKPEKTVFIFGTTRAKRSQLYSKALKKQGIPSIETNAKEQKRLQGFINAFKSGTEIGEGLEGFIGEILEQRKLTEIYLLLACTELPEALGKEGIDRLRQKEIEVVNTQEIFAHEIARQLESIE